MLGICQDLCTIETSTSSPFPTNDSPIFCFRVNRTNVIAPFLEILMIIDLFNNSLSVPFYSSTSNPFMILESLLLMDNYNEEQLKQIQYLGKVECESESKQFCISVFQLPDVVEQDSFCHVSTTQQVIMFVLPSEIINTGFCGPFSIDNEISQLFIANPAWGMIQKEKDNKTEGDEEQQEQQDKEEEKDDDFVDLMPISFYPLPDAVYSGDFLERVKFKQMFGQLKEKTKGNDDGHFAYSFYPLFQNALQHACFSRFNITTTAAGVSMVDNNLTCRLKKGGVNRYALFYDTSEIDMPLEYDENGNAIILVQTYDLFTPLNYFIVNKSSVPISRDKLNTHAITEQKKTIQGNNKMNDLGNRVESNLGNVEKAIGFGPKMDSFNLRKSLQSLGQGTTGQMTNFESSSDFMETNTWISKIAFLIFVLVGFLIVLRLGVSILAYFMSPTSMSKLVTGMASGKELIVIPQNPNLAGSIPISRSVNQPDGIEFTWSVWLFVDDIGQYNANKYKCVFYKGNDFSTDGSSSLGMNFPNNAPGVYIAPNTNNIVVVMNTYDVINEQIHVNDIPLKKWFNLLLRCENDTMDVYVNGSILKSHHLHGVPKQNYGNVYVAPNGGFDGYLSNLYYYSRALNLKDINEIMRKGPNRTMTANGAFNLNNFDYLSLRWFFNNNSL